MIRKDKIYWHKKMMHLIVRLGNFGIKNKILSQEDVTALQKISIKFQAEIDKTTNAQSVATKAKKEWEGTM